jgi:transposase-like protein
LGQKYPAISQSWRRAWAEVVPFYAFPADVRRILSRIPRMIPHSAASWP